MVKVSQVMGKAITIDPSITLRQAAKIMSKKNMAHVIVVKDGRVKGYISEKTVLDNLSSLDKKVSANMSKSIITISDTADLNDAGRVMAQNSMERLPVVKKGKIVGSISFRDVLLHGEAGGEGDFFLN